MGIGVLTGAEARPGGHRILSGWAALDAQCPWATPYTCPELVGIWYEAFEAQYEAVVVYETDRQDRLCGILALARAHSDGHLVPAVHTQASVHGWLARPLQGSYFIERALAGLAERFPGQDLELSALPSGAPTDWTQVKRALGAQARTEVIHHRLLRLDRDRAAKKFEKRANSQQLAGLKKQGALRFEPVLDAETLARHLPDVADWFDGHASDRGYPTRFTGDRAELDFWGRLPVAVPGFCAAGLWVGEVLATVVLGFKIGDRFHLALGVDNPAFESHAPSQISWLMLEEWLLGQDVQDADVTLGFEWMGLGGIEDKECLSVRLLFDRQARVAHDTSRALIGFARWALSIVER